MPLHEDVIEPFFIVWRSCIEAYGLVGLVWLLWDLYI